MASMPRSAFGPNQTTTTVTERLRKMNRELLYATLMVLFILVVEYFRRDRADSAKPGEKAVMEQERKVRPATGDIDFNTK